MTGPSSNPVNPNVVDPSGGAPKVSNRALQLPGVLPKNIRTWAALMVATAMMVTIYCSSGGQKQKGPQAGAPQTPFLTTAREIEQYKAQLDAETRKLTAERQRLAKAKHDAESAERAALVTPAPPPATPAPGEYHRGGSGSATLPAYSPMETERQLTAIDHARREEKSLFASNIALSLRGDDPSQSPPEGTKRLPAIASNPAPAAAPSTTVGDVAAVRDAPNAETREVRNAAAREGNRRRSQSDDPLLQEADGKLHRLFEGTILETILTNRLDGSLAGPVNVLVTTNVYSHDHQDLLIPQGTRVLGEIEKVTSTGQQRLAVFFHRLIMPDGYAHSLDKFQALSQTGEAGLRDQVNHHYVQIFGASLAVGAIAGVEQAGANYGAATGGVDAYQRGSSQSLSQSALHILDRFLNVLPTFTIREGHRIKIILTDDLLLPAYAGHKLPANL